MIRGAGGVSKRTKEEKEESVQSRRIGTQVPARWGSRISTILEYNRIEGRG